MTGYDLFVAIVLIASVAAGAVRGGVRELVSLLSAIVAAFVALIALPVTAPVMRGLIDPDWIGSVVAVIVGFFLVYFLLRLVGSALSKGAKAHGALGAIDRLFGVVIGATRGLLLIGAVHLTVAAGLPGDRSPRWLDEAFSYGLSVRAAHAIQWILPGLGRGVDAVTPLVDGSIRRGFSDDPDLPRP
ncbi:CvpA family protein [Brevundimonas sp. S30B]|uniref:CvpA family protein n=1 Tax=unclassified Brevundimonas TaxID=2622653 RepID=UPI00107245BC|nr:MULTISPECIES: CvpA family protein [unclassified Brevundimonas]QBX38042.1 CvpA family protein [Brevundimonas sp. MF30-B]TFW02604.1 CvpA family protein [Brevundimonas sp. S30B]